MLTIMVPQWVWAWNWIRPSLNLLCCKRCIWKANDTLVWCSQMLTGDTMPKLKEMTINHAPSKRWKLLVDFQHQTIKFRIADVCEITANTTVVSVASGSIRKCGHKRWYTWWSGDWQGCVSLVVGCTAMGNKESSPCSMSLFCSISFLFYFLLVTHIDSCARSHLYDYCSIMYIRTAGCTVAP